MVYVTEDQLAQTLRDKLSFAGLVSSLVSLHRYRRRIFLMPIDWKLIQRWRIISTGFFLRKVCLRYRQHNIERKAKSRRIINEETINY